MVLTNIQYCLVKHCLDHGILSQLAYFIRFKYKHNNSCYYGYNNYRIAKHNSHSQQHIKKYLQFFIERRWVRMHNGNIIFRPLKEIIAIEQIKESRIKEQIIFTTLDVHYIKLRLKRIIFDNNLRQQRHVMNQRPDRQLPTSSKPGESGDDLYCTVKGIGSLLKCSIATSSRIKKKWHDQGWYIFIRNIKLVDAFISYETYAKEWQPLVDKTLFWFKGSMYLTLPSIVIITE